jgi:eukaryotic-like serine/threonine-protein kinase
MSVGLDDLFVSFQAAISGRYSLDREIGRGGMGIVYLAHEVRLDRAVAIKLLPPHSTSSNVRRERFLREARTAARLSHPNIVQIYSVDEVAGFVFYAMAYVSGETLAQRVKTGGPLRPDEGARVLRDVAWALDYAHSLGVVHRDVKPENIMLESITGRVLVTDFGIAQVADAERLTGEGSFVGTPGFVSPEQAMGRSVDARSDVYSLGVVGYYVLSGHLPFEAPSVPELVAKQISAPPPAVNSAVPGIPRKLEKAITRSLAQEPEDRYENAGAFAEALSPVLQQSQEPPAPLRAFLVDMEHQSTTRLLLIGLLAVYLPDVVFSFLAPVVGKLMYNMKLFEELMRWGSALFLSIGFAMVAVVSFRRLRLLVRLGYTQPDLVLTLKRDTERRRAEWASVHPGFPPRLHSVLHATWVAVLGVYGVTVVKVLVLGAWTWSFTTRFTVSPVYWYAVALLAVVGILAAPTLKRASVLSGARLRFWRGRIGKWLFTLASLGQRRWVASESVADRPTEFGLALAIAVLYEGLPRETRRALSDLPAVVEQLEADAGRGRARIDELGELVAEAEERSPRASAEEGRRRLIAELRAAQGIAESRLGELVSALETIRLDLVRLRAGVGNIEGVTADLAEARSLSERIDQVLAGRHEVEIILGDRASRGP